MGCLGYAPGLNDTWSLGGGGGPLPWGREKYDGSFTSLWFPPGFVGLYLGPSGLGPLPIGTLGGCCGKRFG